MTITFNLFSAFGGRPFRVQKRTIDRSTTNLYSDLIFFVLVEGSLKTYFVNLIFRKIWMTEKAVLSHSRIFFSFFSQRRRENIKLGRSLITATPFSRTTVTTTTTTAATTTTNAGCRFSTTNEKLGNRSTQLKKSSFHAVSEKAFRSFFCWIGNYPAMPRHRFHSVWCLQIEQLVSFLVLLIFYSYLHSFHLLSIHRLEWLLCLNTQFGDCKLRSCYLFGLLTMIKV